MDLEALTRDLNALGARLRDDDPAGDLAHLRKIQAWGRAATLIGLATLWLPPNPLTIGALSLGRFARWTMIAHHVGHRGYEKVGGPSGKSFAEGWRRPLDWFDWLVPAAWKHEHNLLHHYRLNEDRDPDLVEANLGWLRASRLPRPLRYLLVAFFALTWKWVYYAPNTLAELHRAPKDAAGAAGAAGAAAGSDGPAAGDAEGPVERNPWTWDPRHPAGRALWLQSVLPYAFVTFGLLPLLALPAAAVAPWGVAVVGFALVNSLLAELLTNVHSFLVIVPNHAGDDLYRFTTPSRGRRDFYVRQILGSANFRTGGDVNDFLHGFLNYQIEHHLWPDLPMRAYQRAQPEVKALCAAHGVPYVQQSVWRRAWKTAQIMAGDASMKVWADGARAAG
jgi:fatty acid desaturase